MIAEGLGQALSRLGSLDPEVWSAVRVSVTVSSAAVLVAALLGLPLGLWLGQARFPGKAAVRAGVHALMAAPTVLIGLVLYALLSRSGPLGGLELLYTPTAMALGQAVLALPLVVGLAAAAVERADPRIALTVLGLGGGRWLVFLALARERRAALVAALAVAFGRVFSEVGISFMLGGNIRGLTRNIPTGIAFETGRGEFALGVALGLVLLLVALSLHGGVALLEAREGEDR
jgi:tungstate transport system permease protein